MSDDVQAGFVRQRRSLILISLALAVVVWFELKGTEIRLAPNPATGISVDFGSIEVIYAGLWIAWLWLFYRYWVYFSACRGKALKDLQHSQLIGVQEVFKDRIIEIGKTMIADKALRARPDGESVEIDNYGLSGNIKRAGWRQLSGQVAGHATVRSGTDVYPLGAITVTANITGMKLYWSLSKTLLAVNIQHRYFSEYWVAFLLAQLPLVAFLISRLKSV